MRISANHKGYDLSDVEEDEAGFTGLLTLGGPPQNIYGKDVKELEFEVEYQSENRECFSLRKSIVVRVQKLNVTKVYTFIFLTSAEHNSKYLKESFLDHRPMRTSPIRHYK